MASGRKGRRTCIDDINEDYEYFIDGVVFKKGKEPQEKEQPNKNNYLE